MKRKWYGVSVLVMLLLLAACSVNRGNTALLRGKLVVPEEGTYYKKQLEAIERDSLSAVPYTNWRQFRTAFFKCRLANPSNLGVPLKTTMELTKAANGSYEGDVAKLAYDILERDYTSIAAHAALSKNLSIYPTVREFHGAVRNALVKSIVNSGDGKSPETAMYVIGVAEEYEALQELGLTQESQRLEQKNNRHYDVFAARDSTGEKRDVYFAVDEFYGMFY
ncbi:DUF4919 domain-containing protein [uncultured Fibrobacter sp.]|uniref:DUF4919 domain-containing protein n=1 Tax=uncultured Fibrobacter sp. TaxID=261512 RepID=UPI002602EBF0|nr:DUF4919 domain-containing protein [uncultured Fibrobacter sp.]